MLLALCEAECEDELICDFAEYYHILNHRELEAGKAAVLCFGLRESSRTKMKLADSKLSLEQALLARIVDENSFQSWTKTKDAQKKRNRPKSVFDMLMHPPKKECEGYDNAEDFADEWKRLTNG